MLRNQKCLTCYSSTGLNQIQVSVGCDSPLSQQRSWDFHVLFITSKTHGIARHMTSQKFLLFGVTNWNDRPTRCSTPPSQIVPYRIFYYLEIVSSRNLLWPEINRTLKFFFFYLILYTTSTPYTQFLDRTIFQGTKTV